jgi:uncharacterized protein
MIVSRRMLLGAPLGLAGAGLATAAYGVAGEQMARPVVTTYRLAPPRWPAGLALRVAVVADIHACEPWMTVERIEGIVDQANALGADLIVLLGDFVVAHRKVTGIVPDEAWAASLARLRAPLGVYAILGNHDWWADPAARPRDGRLPKCAHALEQVGIPVLHNRSILLAKDGRRITLAGLGDQDAVPPPPGRPSWWAGGADDLSLTLAGADPEHPVILLAHEPDIFPKVPASVSLTLAGHTHGGQVRILGYAPVVPSRYGNRFAYGLVTEGGRTMIVSGGLGCSWWPVRLGSPPELVVVDLSAAQSG